MIRFTAEFQELETFSVAFSAGVAFGVSFGGESFRPEQYDGPTEITPSTVNQILNTEGKLITENITVKPIPNNYGLITWNGSTITVS